MPRMQASPRRTPSTLMGTVMFALPPPEVPPPDALITAVDKGALDCTVRARVATALTRAAEWHDYTWEVRQDV